jgi:hypothetical protein
MTETGKTRDRVLSKVRALLAKAESTSFAEEAAALTAKAHELIAAHAIDMAMIEERTGRGEVETLMLFIDAPYAKEKFLLLSSVARANNCRAIYGLGPKGFEILRDDDRLEEMQLAGQFAWIVGYKSDIESVELLFTSLLLQAVNVMIGQGSVSDWNGTNRTKSFRRSFLVGFVNTVDERLEDARERVTTAAEDTYQASVLPVLASRRDAVDAELDAQFPNTGSMKTSVSNYDGIVAGAAAGRRADIGTSRVGGTRKSLR